MARLLSVHCTGPDPAEPIVLDDPVLRPRQVHLWFSTLAAQQHRLGDHAALLDASETERAQRFRFSADRERFITAHGLLRSILGRYLGVAPHEPVFERGTFGKPYLAGTDLRFNLSDTKDAVLLAITREDEIGADLETMARSVDHRAVSAHYFTPEEIADMRSAPDDKRRFLELWTRKEAVLKASGVGIMDDLRVLRVDGRHNTMTIAHEAFMAHAAEVYHVRSWHVGTQHIVSLAMPHPPLQVLLGRVD